MRRAGKGKPGNLHQNHGWEKNENLIDKNARQKLGIAEPLGTPNLEGGERTGAITPFEPQPGTMKNHHLTDPGQNRKRQSQMKIKSHVAQSVADKP